MPTRDNYIVTGNDVEAIKTELNFILQYIGGRLDQLEGVRGKPGLSTKDVSVSGDVTVYDNDDNKIHSFE